MLHIVSKNLVRVAVWRGPLRDMHRSRASVSRYVAARLCELRAVRERAAREEGAVNGRWRGVRRGGVVRGGRGDATARRGAALAS